jgi:hypothetical protein
VDGRLTSVSRPDSQLDPQSGVEPIGLNSWNLGAPPGRQIVGDRFNAQPPGKQNLRSAAVVDVQARSQAVADRTDRWRKMPDVRPFDGRATISKHGEVA